MPVINVAGKCPRCGYELVNRTDSNPGEKTGEITEVCIKCGRTVIWNKQLIL